VVHALEGRLACLMAQHGQVAVGPTLDRALALAVEVETLARIYLQALALGEPPLLSAQQMEQVRHQFRTVLYGVATPASS
jgi:L-fuculose-phosphate aldolase